MAMLTITLNGVTIERDSTKLPQVSRDYLEQNGFSQRLRDSYASVTEKAFPDPTERAAARQAKLDAALAQIDSGEVPGTRVAADPVKTAMAKIIRDMLAKGYTVDDVARMVDQNESKKHKKTA
jgi:hypothetical protein